MLNYYCSKPYCEKNVIKLQKACTIVFQAAEQLFCRFNVTKLFLFRVFATFKNCWM
jgi:hypothetical protein